MQWATPLAAAGPSSSRAGTPGGGARQEETQTYDGLVPNPAIPRPPAGTVVPGAADEDGDEDDVLPDMADDDYSAQQTWQSQSTANLK